MLPVRRHRFQNQLPTNEEPETETTTQEVDKEIIQTSMNAEKENDANADVDAEECENKNKNKNKSVTDVYKQTDEVSNADTGVQLGADVAGEGKNIPASQKESETITTTKMYFSLSPFSSYLENPSPLLSAERSNLPAKSSRLPNNKRQHSIAGSEISSLGESSPSSFAVPPDPPSQMVAKKNSSKVPIPTVKRIKKSKSDSVEDLISEIILLLEPARAHIEATKSHLLDFDRVAELLAKTHSKPADEKRKISRSLSHNIPEVSQLLQVIHAQVTGKNIKNKITRLAKALDNDVTPPLSDSQVESDSVEEN